MKSENMTSDCLERQGADLRPPPTYRAADPPPTLGRRSTSVCIGLFVVCFVLFALCDGAARSCWAAGFTVPTCDTKGVLMCCTDHECHDRSDLTNLSPSWWKRTEHNCDSYKCRYNVMQMTHCSHRVPTISLEQHPVIEDAEFVYINPYPYSVCVAAKGTSYVAVAVTAYFFVTVCNQAYLALRAYACSALSVEARHVD